MDLDGRGGGANTRNQPVIPTRFRIVTTSSWCWSILIGWIVVWIVWMGGSFHRDAQTTVLGRSNRNNNNNTTTTRATRTTATTQVNNHTATILGDNTTTPRTRSSSSTTTMTTPQLAIIQESGQRRGIVWLMSFPNSGTSFTMSMIQRASNRSTATNYGIEGQWDIQYNVPALSLLDGGGGGDSVMKNYDGHHPHYNHDSRTVGPFITRGGLRQQLALPSRYILTKTHCTLAQNRPSSSSSRHNIGGLRGIDPLVCYFRRPLLPPDEKRQQHPLSHQLPVIDFAQACASGYRLTRGVENENDVKFTNNSVHHVTTQGDERRYPLQFRRDYVEYAPQSVDKAIHLIRHPLDNLVSRYHLHARNLWNMKRQRQEKDDDSDPYKNYSFAQHCAKLNADPNYACWRPLLPKIRQGFDQTQSRKTNDTDEDDKNNDDEKGVRIVEPPCWPDLLKYVWWHNHAFAMTAGPVLLNQEEDETWEGTPSLPPQPLIQGGGLWRRYWHQPLPTLVLYYEDYNRDLNATRQGLLDWLDQPLVALDRGPDFDWKMYRDTEYTAEERHAVRLAIQTWATPTTWHHLQQRYYSDHQKWHEQSKPKDM